MSTSPERPAALPSETTGVGGLVVVWQTVRKHWSTALATALVVSLGVVFYTLGLTKIYESSSTVVFDPNPPRPLGQKVESVVEMGAGSYWDNREYYETQYQIITSSRVAQKVVEDLGLDHDGAFLLNLPPGTPPPQTSMPIENAAELVRGRLKVDPIKNSRLAVVKYSDADPKRAQRILAAVVDTYIQLNLEDALSSTNQAVDWLRGQLDKLKTDLESSEMALHEYKKDKNILSVQFDDQSNMLREEMQKINDALTQVRTHHEEVAARYAELQKVNPENPSDLPASEFLQSVLLQNLRQRYEDAVRERDALLGSGKGPKHPEVEAAESRVDAARKSMAAEVANVRGALKRDLAVLERQTGGLSGLFESAKKQAFDLNLLEIEYNRLRRSKDNTEKLYSMLLERTKESDLTRMLRVNNIRVIDRADLPRGPIWPKVPLNIATGIVIGVLLGIGAAVLRAVLDRTVKTPDDLEQEIGVNFLGLIPELDEGTVAPYGNRRRRKPQPAIGAPELIVHDRPMSAIAEASRVVRTNLMFSSPDNPYRVLVITSAGPAEGKTTVACCVAIAMAQTGQSVLLVDCDLRRPRVHRIFKTGSNTGVTTALLDGNIDDAVFSTPVPNLSVIPSGPLPPNPAEIFHSERFKTFLASIASRYDRVILDTPPVVAVTDATVLSALSDGVLIVVRAFETRKELARHALRLLNDVGVKVVGAVLNAVNFRRVEYKYSYQYYRRDDYSPRPPEGDRPSKTATPPAAHAD